MPDFYWVNDNIYIPCPHCGGTGKIRHECTQYTIRLVKKIYDRPWESQDMELTLVHELLHVRHTPYQAEGDNLHHEQAIESIAKALVALKRSREPAPILDR